MLCVRLITDPFDLSAYSEHQVDALIPFLQEQFTTWPETARLYDGSIAVANDVTPRTEDEVAALEQATDGTYYVVVYPGDPVTAIISVVVALALTAVMLLFLMPKIDNGGGEQSSNNSLGQRVNKARPNERIPDIFGSVLSIPELLTVPFLFFEEKIEREVSLMCVGRGSYEITDVRDGDTPLENIAGSSASFYGPNTSPNSGDPFLTIGADIDVPLLDIVRLNDVNGQVLRPPNANQVSGDDDIRFVYPDTIQRLDSGIDFTDYFDPGDTIDIASAQVPFSSDGTRIVQSSRFTSAGTIVFETFDPRTVYSAGQQIVLENAAFADDNESGGITYIDVSGTYTIASISATTITLTSPTTVTTDWTAIGTYVGDTTAYRGNSFSTPSGTVTFNLNGSYEALSVSPSEIVLANPVLVNPAWDNLDDLPGDQSEYISPTLSTSNERWVGPFIVDMPNCDRVVANIFAPQGVYEITKKGKWKTRTVSAEVEVTPIDENDEPSGAPVSYPVTLSGNKQEKDPQGVTVWAELGSPGRCQVRVRRTSSINYDSDNTKVDEIKWRDAYGAAPVTQEHFGDVTTVHTLTIATPGATSVKERKLNCRATRKILERNADDTFGPALVPSVNAADIICHMALDPHIGGRAVTELDVAQIYETAAEIEEYFGIADAVQFCYTFDKLNTSFEEMVQSVAQAVFSTAYRQGSVFRLFFEKERDDSTMLFNHRNKVPGSEQRTIRFGYLNDFDGVELDYVDPEDGAKLTLYAPEDQSALKAKKLELVGVQSEKQAILHLMRAWNKIRYQTTTTQFDALAEASQLILSERIEVTDNTRPDVFDGELVAQDGMILTLSQPFTPKIGTSYTIFLQLEDGVQSMPVYPTADPYRVAMSGPPRASLVLGEADWIHTGYQITGSNDARSSGFLLTEKGSFDRKTLSIQAINYDSRYYQDDGQYR